MRKFKKIYLYILVILGTFIITHEPTTLYFQEQLQQIFSLNSNEDNNNEIVGDKYLKSISGFWENDFYYYILYLNNVDNSEVRLIEINSITYNQNDFTANNLENSLTLCLKDNISFTENPYYSVVFENIVINSENHNLNFETFIFKEITNETIDNSKKTVVSVKAYNEQNEVSWGSGIIISKKENWRSGGYEYYVLTNHHVVQNSNFFYIYYQNKNGKASTARFATLLKVSDDNTDLALLSFSTLESLPHLDEDNQFKTLVPNIIIKNQPVYTIGSPNGNNINFNRVAVGVIQEVYIKVILEDQLVICQNGCQAIRTNAILAEGSSGGGTFDANGNLVGIHFAGSKNKDFATSIPLEIILDFIAAYLTKEVQPDFFFFYSTTL